MVQLAGRRRCRSDLAAFVISVGLCAFVALTALTKAQSAPQLPDRTKFLELQREAVNLLQQAARADARTDDVRRAIVEAGHRLEALGADTENEALLPAALRADVRRAAGELAEIAAAQSGESPARFDATRVLALLEKVRHQLEGEVALGLSFQGSYSQTKPREAAYGGHASAMGPAPALPAPSADPSPSRATFEEAPRLATKTYCGGATKDHILESACGGVALFDYDGDGWLDIYLVTAAELGPGRERIPHPNALYRNLGGWKFEDVSRRAGVDAAQWGSGACVGDYNGDGRLDLYVTNWGTNALFRNRGDGSFEDVAASAGVGAGGWSTGCTFFDADADGDLDLYVARYVETSWDSVMRAQRTLVWRNGPHIMVGPAGLPGESDLFFENLGNGRFVEATDAHGLSDSARAYGMGVVATDYDNDGFVDLFVANDSNPNFLYRNLGTGKFESVGLLAGVAVNGDARAQAGMGVDAGDFDGDSRMDLVLTAFAHDRNTLYRNIDGRRFEDASVAAGLAAATFVRMGWGVAFLDADLDGRPDLFFANGHIFADIDNYQQLGETFRQKNQIMLNEGNAFRDVSDRAGGGLQLARVGRGLAVGDLDNDGDPDVVISNMDDAPTLLENRQRTGNHWVAIRVAGPGGNRFAIGARVTVTTAAGKQVREIRSGGSYLSQSDLRTYFGLGQNAGTVDIEVRMPGGRRWEWRELPVDRLHDLSLEGPGTESKLEREAGSRR